MAAARGADRPAGLPHGTSRFAFFSEVLVTGVIVFVLSLPLLTAVPALAAGSAHLGRHLEGRPDDLRRLWADFRAALLSGGWLVSLGTVALLGLLDFNVNLAATGALPGGRIVQVVSAAVAAVVAVVVLRAVDAWADQPRWRAALRVAAARSAADVGGSALLVAAVGLCAVIVWMLLPLLFVVPGLLCLAVVAVRYRAGATQ